MNKKEVQMKDLVKKLSKLSKAFLVLCLSMVVMMGSAQAGELCGDDPINFTVGPCSSNETQCVEKYTTNKTVESLRIQRKNVTETEDPQTITIEFHNNGDYIDAHNYRTEYGVLWGQKFIGPYDEIDFRVLPPVSFNVTLKEIDCK